MIIYTDKGWVNRKRYTFNILGFNIRIRIDRKVIKTLYN